MTNLFTSKQIVGICFLFFMVWFYTLGGFNYQMPELEIPTFGSPFPPETPNVIKKDSSNNNLALTIDEKIQFILQKYPSPQDLQNAVNTGEVDYNWLPQYFKSGANYPAIHP